MPWAICSRFPVEIIKPSECQRDVSSNLVYEWTDSTPIKRSILFHTREEVCQLSVRIFLQKRIVVGRVCSLPFYCSSRPSPSTTPLSICPDCSRGLTSPL